LECFGFQEVPQLGHDFRFVVLRLELVLNEFFVACFLLESEHEGGFAHLFNPPDGGDGSLFSLDLEELLLEKALQLGLFLLLRQVLLSFEEVVDVVPVDAQNTVLPFSSLVYFDHFELLELVRGHVSE